MINVKRTRTLLNIREEHLPQQSEANAVYDYGSELSDHFSGTDRRQRSIHIDIDVFTDESTAAIAERKLTPANMLAGKGIVVWPVANILRPFQHRIDGNRAGCCDGIRIVPPIPLAPARHCFPNGKGVGRSVRQVSHTSRSVCVLLIGAKNSITRIQAVGAAGILSIGR